MSKIKNQFLDYFKKGYSIGAGIAAALLTTALLAVTFAQFKTWTAGEILSSTDLNNNFALLRNGGQISVTPFNINWGMSGWPMYFGLLDSNGALTEATQLYTFQRDAEIRNFRVKCTANAQGAAVTFTVRKNQVDTAASITVPVNTVGTFTSAAVVPFTAGDLFSLSGFNPGGGKLMSMTCSLEYQISP